LQDNSQIYPKNHGYCTNILTEISLKQKTHTEKLGKLGYRSQITGFFLKKLRIFLKNINNFIKIKKTEGKRSNTQG
jgi:hypothetical protein